jgi:predicted nuclease with TOPRIM domain
MQHIRELEAELNATQDKIDVAKVRYYEDNTERNMYKWEKLENEWDKVFDKLYKAMYPDIV